MQKLASWLNGTFLPIESIFKIIGKQISKKIENKFNNLGIIFVEDSQQGIYHILDAETKATLKTGNKKQIKNWIEKVDKKNPDDAKKFVDDLKEKASKDIENSKLSAAEKLTLAKKLWKEYKYKDFMEKPPKKPCFLAGTLIHTTSGLKPIEEIKTGDQVWCFDEIKQELAQQKVSETFSNFAEKYAKITTQSGEEFLVTGQHLFYQKNSKTWIKAYQLKVGMHLYNAKNNSLDKITKTQIINQKTTTYNFEVPTHHNYLVGNAGILTHNGPGYKTTTLRKYAFYRLTTIDITDTLETQYIGKTTRSLNKRAEEHLYEGKRAKEGIKPHYEWKSDSKLGIFNLNDGPLEYIEMTEFESAVVEKFHLENHRYKTGWELKNRQNPLSEKAFNKWKKFHSDRNPCLFFV